MLERIGVFALILYVALIVAGLTGYVKNIVKLIDCDFEQPYKAEIVRAIGVPFAPMGAIVGWIDIDDTPKGAK